MSNKSITQVHKEIAVAKKEALKRPHQHEVLDCMVSSGEDVNLLSDVVVVRDRGHSSGKQSVLPLKERIEIIFAKFPVQYELLGLYHGAGFTFEEIAEMRGDTRSNVKTTVTRAIARLKKQLTPDEFGSISWALRVRPVLQATPRVDDSIYDNTHSQFAPYGIPVGHDGIRVGELRNFFGATMITWEDGDVEALGTWRKEVPHAHVPEKTLPVPQTILLKEKVTA